MQQNNNENIILANKKRKQRKENIFKIKQTQRLPTSDLIYLIAMKHVKFTPEKCSSSRSTIVLELIQFSYSLIIN